MASGIDFADNPFFLYDMKILCAVCNKRLEKTKYSIFEPLQKQSNQISLLEVLESVSDYSNSDGPEYVCKICYFNTIAANKFRLMCNNSHERLNNYLKHQAEMQIKVKNDKQLIQKCNKAQLINDNQLNMKEPMKLNENEPKVLLTADELTNVGLELQIENCKEEEKGTENDQADLIKDENIELNEANDEINMDLRQDDSDVNNDGNVGMIEEVEKGTTESQQEEKVNINASKRTTCKVCHKSYRADYLQVHMRIHTGERPYQCSVCNKGFGTSTTLKLHKASHSDNREFICRYCGSRFKLYRTLQIHERSHTGERPFKCDQCDKSFISASRRKQHKLVHSGEKQFTCHLCAKSFTRSTILKDHLKAHAGIKNFTCHMCGNRFSQAHSLRTHLQKSCLAQKIAVEDESAVAVIVVEEDCTADFVEYVCVHKD